MFVGVVDTHTALWCMFGDARLSLAAKAFIDEAAQVRHKIALSAISLAEIVCLIEKQRIAANAYEDIKKALNNPDHVLRKRRFKPQSLMRCRECPVRKSPTCRTAS